MYEHLLSLGRSRQIDLFVYAREGTIEVPWKIVTMIREFTDKFSVLVPYKAFSATTLLALGADEIVMGRKAELGPIDPQIKFEKPGEPGTVVQSTISTEDVMSYLNFLKDTEKADLSDQSARALLINKLVESLGPSFVGQINRVHSHIRDVARKMLASRNSQFLLKEPTINSIVDQLAEKTYQHGHAIGRHEATEIGLNISLPPKALEDSMWQLFSSYEELCQLQNPIDPQTIVPPGTEERRETLVIACIESTNLAHHFGVELVGRVKRATPPQLNINLTQNLNLPPGVDPQQVPAAVQGILQQMLQDFQRRAQQIIQDELRKQMPAIGVDLTMQSGQWRAVQGW